MQGMGKRLRARAVELGWSDAEVARRLGLAQTRYASYVTDKHEPDLATLLRICAVLGVPVTWLLGVAEDDADGAGGALARSVSTLKALDPASFHIAAAVLDALLSRSISSVAKPGRRPAAKATPKG